MTFRPASAAASDVLANPRGGRVPAAQQALASARHAIGQRSTGQHGGQYDDVAVPLQHAAHALRDAGWLAAARNVDTLLSVLPVVLSSPAAGEASALFNAALHDLCMALERRNLYELSCSPQLFAWQRALSGLLTPAASGLAFEDIALAGRLVPRATLDTWPTQHLEQLRARYEAVLLPALRMRLDGSRAAAEQADAAFIKLDDCMAQLVGTDPYDFWRLAAACARAMRNAVQADDDGMDIRRFYARCNLVLADQAKGVRVVPQSLVRATLALLWRRYALSGATIGDADVVELLNDYGLTATRRDADAQMASVLWEAQSTAVPERELGGLAVNANGYEDFLQTADASMTVLADCAHNQRNAVRPDPGSALLAAAAAYRLGLAAWACGLGQTGLLADALGLAWRRTAHAVALSPDMDMHGALVVPDQNAVGHASESLRAMLLRIAAGVAPPDAGATVKALGDAIGAEGDWEHGAQP